MMPCADAPLAVSTALAVWPARGAAAKAHIGPNDNAQVMHSAAPCPRFNKSTCRSWRIGPVMMKWLS
jgi:hypothetical protein